MSPCQLPLAMLLPRINVGSLKRILEHLGEPTTSPPIASARGPPHGEKDFDPHESTEGTDLSERAASESQGQGMALLGAPRTQRTGRRRSIQGWLLYTTPTRA